MIKRHFSRRILTGFLAVLFSLSMGTRVFAQATAAKIVPLSENRFTRVAQSLDLEVESFEDGEGLSAEAGTVQLIYYTRDNARAARNEFDEVLEVYDPYFNLEHDMVSVDAQVEREGNLDKLVVTASILDSDGSSLENFRVVAVRIEHIIVAGYAQGTEDIKLMNRFFRKLGY